MSQSQSRRKGSQTELADGAAENKLKNAVVHVLAMEKQPAFTKDADLKKQLELRDSHEFKILLRTCDEKFRDCLGIRLTHTEGKTFTCSNLKCSEKQGFLTTILTAIFMYEYNEGSKNKNPMTETKFWDFLNTMDLEQDKIDEALGDLKKLVGRNTGEFFLNGWLHVSRVRVDDRAEHYYEWGPRATTCVDPMKLLEWYCEVDGSQPKDWVEHYEVARTKSRWLRDIHKSKNSYF